MYVSGILEFSDAIYVSSLSNERTSSWRSLCLIGGRSVKKAPVFNIADQMLTVAEAVRDLQAGRMVILCDDEERENEADMCLAAQFATSEKINFIVRQACGLLCVAMSGERLDALRLPL